MGQPDDSVMCDICEHTTNEPTEDAFSNVTCPACAASSFQYVADHKAAAAIHRAAALAHRGGGNGAEWRTKRAADWSRTAECHRPQGGQGPGRADSRNVAKLAREAAIERQRAYSQEQAGLDRTLNDQRIAELSEAAAKAHDMAAAAHDRAII